MNKLTFWFYVAMFYKMAFVPYLLSPFYLLYLLFKIEIFQDDYTISHVFWVYLLCVILFLLISAIEYNPKYITKVVPSSMIPNSQGVIDQHRLWIAFANVIYSVCVYFFLTKANIDFLHCREGDTMSVCNAVIDTFYLHNGWILIAFVVFYWVCAFYVKSTLEVKRN
ncbi:hypothetical protein WA588_000788 [Blastocystis sp. NMH]